MQLEWQQEINQIDLLLQNFSQNKLAMSANLGPNIQKKKYLFGLSDKNWSLYK